MQIAVIGAGTMGRGIAETAAAHGISTIVVEPAAAQRDSAKHAIRKSVTRAIEKGKLAAASADEVLGRLDFQSDLSAAFAADVVIEAAPEREDLKSQIFQELDRGVRSSAVLASNTSSISITRLGRLTSRPDRVIGMHFFNPVPVMAPVEIVRGDDTSDAAVETVRILARQMGKQALVVRDRPGFVVNRVLMPLINEAAHALHAGVADAATIDTLMKLGCNHPMGPLELADFVGLDVCVAILEILHRDLGEEKFRPSPALVELVRRGRLGRKSGAGFYDYP